MFQFLGVVFAFVVAALIVSRSVNEGENKNYVRIRRGGG